VSGKFDQLCKEFMPLLPIILDKLSDLLKGSYKVETRNLFIELCLTVPAKLHVLCPYLPLLIRPVLYSLQSDKEDLVTFGLRNLDMWVNTLRTESLEPILRPVMPELLVALFSHLKPQPHPFGILSMKILAKLGGMNRKYLIQPNMTFDPHSNDLGSLAVTVQFITSNQNSKQSDSIQQEFNADAFAKTAKKILSSSSTSTEMKLEAFHYIKYCVMSVMNLKDSDKLPEQFVYNAKKQQQMNQPVGTRDLQQVSKIKERNLLMCKLISTLLYCVSDPDLKSVSIPLAQLLCRHFAISAIAHRDSSQQDGCLDISIFYDSIVDVFYMSMGDDQYRAAEYALEEFIEYVFVLCDHDEEFVNSLPCWDQIANRLCHSCYQKEWYKKCGGSTGIVILCRNLSVKWLRKSENNFLKALLSIVKDSPAQMASYTFDEAIKALEIVIKICYDANQSTYAISSSGSSTTPVNSNSKLHELLVSELSSSHAAVRKTVQSLIKLVSELCNRSITHILEPFKERLISSIREERYIQLPVHLQTGFCEAVTFFLSLEPPLFTLTQQIGCIVNRALNVISIKNDKNAKEQETKKITFSLKMACMKLVREALNCPDMRASEHSPIRNKIIEVFFGYLNSANKEIVGIAKSGLATFISQQRLPKDLLQTSLRPILSHLGNYQKLDIAVLQTLSHLLELCTSYFSIKLGEQLLEHLRKWTDPTKVTHLSVPERPLVAAHVMLLFSLLPPDAKKFLPQLVTLTVQLEESWKEYCSEFASPFRQPLAKFLNLYPLEATSYFMDQLVIKPPAYFKLFVNIIKCELAPRLRSHLAQEHTMWSNICFSQTSPANYSAYGDIVPNQQPGVGPPADPTSMSMTMDATRLKHDLQLKG